MTWGELRRLLRPNRWWIDAERAARQSFARFQASGDMTALEAAIAGYRSFLGPDDTSVIDTADRPVPLNGLALCLKARYDAQGGMEDLDAAVDIWRRQVLVVPGNGREADHRANLADALLSRYEGLGLPQDLAAAEREAAWACNAQDITPQQRASYRMTLGNVLMTRFEATGDFRHLDQAQKLLELALAEIDDAHRPHVLVNLGGVGFRRFQRTHDARYAAEAVRWNEEALSLVGDDDPARSLHLHDLAAVLFMTGTGEGDIATMERAIALWEEALAASDGAHPLVPDMLNALGSVQHQCHTVDGDLRRLTAAAEYKRKAVRLAGTDPRRQALLLTSLASTLQELPESRTDPAAQAEIAALYRDALEAGRSAWPGKTLEAAKRWAEWAQRREAWDEAEEALRAGLTALDELVALQTRRTHAEDWLYWGVGLATEAAAVMARTGRAEEAADTADRGRAILMERSLQRTWHLLDDLPEDEARRLSGDHLRAVRHAPARSATGTPADADPRRTWERIQAAVGRPASDGERPRESPPDADPLVWLLTAGSGGWALIRAAGQTRAVALPELSYAAVERQLNRYSRAYQVHRSLPPLWRRGLDELTQWLWDAAMGPVLDALPVGGRTEQPGVAIVPCGVLGMLPLAAAWTPAPSRPCGRAYVLDAARVRCLPAGRFLTPHRPWAPVTSACVVHGPGLATVADSDAAVRAVAQRVTSVSGPATPEAVVATLHGHDLVHFNCHGRASDEDPLLNALLLDSGPLLMRDIVSADLASVQLAVLAACETAHYGLRLPDEVIGFPATLLETGVSGVVSTLWRVPATAATELTTRFYQLLHQQGPSLTSDEALRRAQQGVRDSTLAEKRCLLQGAEELRGLAGADDARVYEHPVYWAGFQYTG